MINKTIMEGRLVKDPELRHTQSGKPVAMFTLACERSFAGTDGKRGADFFDCVAWEKKAEFVSAYLGKGRKVFVTGRFQTRKWQDKNGDTRTAFELMVDEISFGDSKQTENTGFAQSRTTPNNTGFAESEFTEMTDFNDELPF